MAVYFQVLECALAAGQCLRGTGHAPFLEFLRNLNTRLARRRSQAEPFGPSPR